MEVGLWKDYLVFAQLYGIADKVAQQFQKLYPADFDKFVQSYGMNNSVLFSSIYYSTSVSSGAYNSAFSAKSSAEASRRSSGHGGGASISFGGGFSGGGHGGSR